MTLLGRLGTLLLLQDHSLRDQALLGWLEEERQGFALV